MYATDPDLLVEILCRKKKKILVEKMRKSPFAIAGQESMRPPITVKVQRDLGQITGTGCTVEGCAWGRNTLS